MPLRKWCITGHGIRAPSSVAYPVCTMRSTGIRSVLVFDHIFIIIALRKDHSTLSRAAALCLVAQDPGALPAHLLPSQARPTSGVHNGNCRTEGRFGIACG